MRDPSNLICTDRNFVVWFFSLARSSCPKCPIDGKNIARYTSFHDKCCEREVLNLQCCCRYEDRECDWLGNFRQLQVNSLLPALSGEGRRKVSNCSLTWQAGRANQEFFVARKAKRQRNRIGKEVTNWRKNEQNYYERTYEGTNERTIAEESKARRHINYSN